MGVLTFELIFGRIPFDIRTQEDMSKIVEEELKFPYEREISGECKDFIMRCLEKDSFKRWDTSRLLKHAFLRKE
jgi:serine/threonine protein kinase